MDLRDATAFGAAFVRERAAEDDMAAWSARAPDPLPAAMQRDPAHGPVEVLKVSTRSRPSALAGAIAGVIREAGHVEIQAIGAGATNQAVKAIAIARGYLVEDGLDLWCVPSFLDVLIDGDERTALRLVIEARPR